MKRVFVLALMAAGLWLGCGAGAAQAQFFNPFRKPAPPPPPEQRIGQLIGVIKDDKDERKRVNAVIELRELDTKTFPEIVPFLAELAKSDGSAGVRAEAVTSLVRIRPVSNTAGLAIEHASTKDENWRNRVNAQAALVRYRLAGYSSSAAHDELKPPTPTPAPTPPPSSSNGKQFPQSGEPPLADPAPVYAAPKPGLPPVIGIPTSNPTGIAPYPAYTPPPLPQPPGQIVPAPTQPPAGPPSSEPVFRNLNRVNPVPPQPTAPTPGPSLDLPPLPINPTPAPSTPAQPAPTQGPSLETSTPPAPPAPAGRLDPSPRLTPDS